MENMKVRRLRLWKARQETEGYDVSKVKTLEDAEHFFDKKRKKNIPSSVTDAAVPPSTMGESLELPKEEIEDEQCDIDPPGQPV